LDGFFPGLQKGQLYLFYVIGLGGQSLKRDPYARALTADDNPLNWRCILEDAGFPWHDAGFVTPAYSDMVIYQLHVGTFYAPNLPLMGTFLDVAAKIPYLSALGVTVIQLMPIHEFESRARAITGQIFSLPKCFIPYLILGLLPTWAQ
jgi:1,4-alpha-glucan branching enzyme